MKSNSQPIKLFLVVAFSCTNLLVSLTPVLAKPNVGSSTSMPTAGYAYALKLKQAILNALFNQPQFHLGLLLEVAFVVERSATYQDVKLLNMT